MASRPDASSVTALGAPVVQPVFLAWLDIVGDPARATTFYRDVAPIGTGDSDLDGQVFSAVDPTFVTVSPINFREGGTETVKASLSGLIGPDNDLLNLLGNTANWRGREARFWQGVLLPSGTIGLWSYHSGRMVSANIEGSSAGQTITMTIESYQAALAPAANRTYLDQSSIDPGDQSAAATIACSNGIGGSGVTPAFAGGGSGGGSGRGIDADVKFV